MTVKGNVTVSGTGSAGVSANNNATVEVTGNVQAKGDNQTHKGQQVVLILISGQMEYRQIMVPK